MHITSLRLLLHFWSGLSRAVSLVANIYLDFPVLFAFFACHDLDDVIHAFQLFLLLFVSFLFSRQVIREEFGSLKSVQGEQKAKSRILHRRVWYVEQENVEQELLHSCQGL